MFQFQCGAIKTKRAAEDAIAYALFQFQCGAIKTLKAYIKYLPLAQVSIPVWCD